MEWVRRRRQPTRFALTAWALLIAWMPALAEEEINWEQPATLSSEVILSLITASGGSVYAGTQGDGVYRSADGGESWAQAGLSDFDVFSLAAGGGTVYAGTWDGVYRSVDGGDSWA